jgi:hypothetical protein
MFRILLLFKLLMISLLPSAQEVDNIILITLDGLRWQEVFGGATDSLIDNEEYTREKDYINQKFRAINREEARKKLLPWVWSTLAENGQLYGNRWEGNKMNCTNRFWFSYPGYNEILTGFSDPWVNSNEKKYNRNKTILEWFHEKPEFKGKVAAFASWDVFPYIINDQRSGIPVNAGFGKARSNKLSHREQFLNDLQDQIPSPWSSVRLDAFTHHYMMEYLAKEHPRLVYISYGETDDFAHDGKYDQYLKSAHQTDRWLRHLWEFMQSDPFYAGKTSMIITTDHGRGYVTMPDWKSHGTIYQGSGEIWMAAIGPNVMTGGEIKSPMQLFQNQIAATLAAMLGYHYSNQAEETGTVIKTIFENNHE